MSDSIFIDKLMPPGQDHVIKFYNELTDEQKAQLESDIRQTDWHRLNQIYKDQVLTQLDSNNTIKPNSKIDDSLIDPLSSELIEGTDTCNKEAINNYEQVGLDAIGEGKVAALLMAGGQGTRLGVSYPKGMYKIGKKSLFELQADRIKQLQAKVSATGNASNILWYIMTSGPTMKQTSEFFDQNNYFNMSRDNIIFFEQNTIPCFGFDGKVLLDQKFKLSKSPEGNGGIFTSLHDKGVIDHMLRNGVEYVHCFCVDNVLVRVCDPIFMGYCISKQVDCGAKVVEKREPTESVGVICKVKSQFKVIEYSEISDSIANKRDEGNKLVFNAGNICDHFFNVSFLKKINGLDEFKYHLAIKKIPYIDLDTGNRIEPNATNGIKLEKFIFDIFQMTQRFAAWRVNRDDEFSPLKNGPGSTSNNPETALKSLSRAIELGILEE